LEDKVVAAVILHEEELLLVKYGQLLRFIEKLNEHLCRVEARV
jgi:hypothetical protein